MNQNEKFVNQFLEKINRNGGDIQSLVAQKEELLKRLKEVRDYSPLDYVKKVGERIAERSEMFLQQKNELGTDLITSIATGIYLPGYQDGYQINVYGGVEDRYIDSASITPNTLFDSASITKLFTAILIFEFARMGYLDLEEKVVTYLPEYPNYDDFTLIDLMRLSGSIGAPSGVDIGRAKTVLEAEELLKQIEITSHDRSINTYNDFGSIMLGKVMERVMEEMTGHAKTFGEIMDFYLLKPLGLMDSKFNPIPGVDSITGNGNRDGVVHDPKTRALGGITGSAGLYVTGRDLTQLAKQFDDTIYQTGIISKRTIEQLGTITYPSGNMPQKGHLGMYQKHPLGLDKTFVPKEYATGTFAGQGWTGPLTIYDVKNRIHNHILVGAVEKPELQWDKAVCRNNKPIGFGDAFDHYEAEIAMESVMLLMVKEYFEIYEKEHEATYEKQLTK